MSSNANLSQPNIPNSAFAKSSLTFVSKALATRFLNIGIKLEINANSQHQLHESRIRLKSHANDRWNPLARELLDRTRCWIGSCALYDRCACPQNVSSEAHVHSPVRTARFFETISVNSAETSPDLKQQEIKSTLNLQILLDSLTISLQTSNNKEHFIRTEQA